MGCTVDGGSVGPTGCTVDGGSVGPTGCTVEGVAVAGAPGADVDVVVVLESDPLHAAATTTASAATIGRTTAFRVIRSFIPLR